MLASTIIFSLVAIPFNAGFSGKEDYNKQVASNK
jgi:hypothetical protein